MDDAVGSHDSGVFFKQFSACKIKRIAVESVADSLPAAYRVHAVHSIY